MTWDPWLDTANAALMKQAGRELSDVEVAILTGANQGLTYGQIAEQSGYSASYLERDIGPKLWRLLSKALGRKVSKTSFRSAINSYQSELDADLAGDSPTQPSSSAPSPLTIDLLEAPCPPVFYGRDEELEKLASWLLGEGSQAACRLVAILGIGGIGKTAFAATLVQQVQGQFERVIWKNLSNAPPLKTLLQELLPFLSGGKALAPEPRQLLMQLQSTRCLVILDNVESLLQPDFAGQWRPGYEAYGELLQQIGSLNHQSCVLLTSREKPGNIAQLEGPTQLVRSFPLGGLNEAALAFLEAEGLSGTQAQLEKAIATYGGNPLALKIVSASIRDLFEGNIGDFLACDTFLFNGVRRLLDEQFDRLSELEQSVMYWLGINREWTSVRSLQVDFVPTVAMEKVLEALEQLCWRSLLEREGGRYTQQPVVMEYVTSRLIQEANEELMSGEFDLLTCHSLFKTTVKDYVGTTQWRLFLNPIAQELQRNFATTETLQSHIQNLLNILRQQESGRASYAAGNLLNLSLELSLDLSNHDYGQLNLAHGNFQTYNVQSLNLAGTNLKQSSFTDHSGSALTATFSPDSQLLVSGDTEGNIYVRRVPDGEIIHILHGHQSWAREMSFSPDGRVLASASHDRTIKLWDLETGLCLKTFTGHQDIIGQALWHPTEAIIASCSFDQTIKLWDINTGECLKTLKGRAMEVSRAEWSLDGKYLIACDGGNGGVIWDVNSGEIVQSFDGHQAQVTFISQNNDGTLVATASQDGSLKIWNVETGQCIQTLTGDFPPSYCVMFHPKQSLVASACFDGMVRLWDWSSGKCIQVLTGHQNVVWYVSFSPDGQYLVSTSDDRSVKLWDVASNQCLKTWQGYLGAIWDLSITPSGIVAAGSQEGKIQLWNCDTAQRESEFTGHNNLIWFLEGQPQGDYLASASGDGTLIIWDIKSGQPLQIITDHKAALQAAAWHPDGSQVASSAAINSWIKIHDPLSGDCIRTLKANSYIFSVAYDSSGNYLVGGTQDGRVCVWNNKLSISEQSLTESNCLAILEGHQGSVWSLAWNADGSRFASGSHDGTIRIWQGNIWQEQTCLTVLQGHQAFVWSIAWNPDGDRLVSGSQDGTARIWDVETGQCLKILSGSSSWIRSVVWLNDRDVIATAGGDGCIRLWDVESGECLKVLRAKRPYEGTNIYQATGISPAQRASLLALGAIEQPLKS